ncbi:hypothetical protein GE061_006443 [Apolygus lucorum]|uniref:Uncharacterized protein n=1 Tax=Apolygus lucorum TaxID=248454 RepID=A0A6A4IZ44_APOLU|nr:hypothetical protein GE061_006443 [Apolygus lucorum]
MECRWLLIVCLMLLLQLSFEATSEQSSGGKNVKRQTKRRNIGFFGLLRNFVRDTIADTNFVIRNITDIVSEEFPPPQQDVFLSFANLLYFLPNTFDFKAKA